MSEVRDAVLVEYVYEQAQYEDHNGHIAYEVRPHPIIKRTDKRIYFTQRGRIRVIDRARFEATGDAWIRAAGGFFVYRDRSAAEPIPQETPAEKVSRLRTAMAAVHPDRGGDPAAFRAAYARYQAAVNRQKAQAGR